MKETPLNFPEDVVVIGLALSTSRQTAAKDIPEHWQKFMSSELRPRLAPNDGRVHAVYCDYTSDFRGPYTMVLGYAVPASQEVPEGLRRVRLPRGDYASFQAEGDPSIVVNATWEHINGAWEKKANRRYIADFERYAETGPDEPVKVEVAVGLS